MPQDHVPQPQAADTWPPSAVRLLQDIPLQLCLVPWTLVTPKSIQQLQQRVSPQRHHQSRPISPADSCGTPTTTTTKVLAASTNTAPQPVICSQDLEQPYDSVGSSVDYHQDQQPAAHILVYPHSTQVELDLEQHIMCTRIMSAIPRPPAPGHCGVSQWSLYALPTRGQSTPWGS